MNVRLILSLVIVVVLHNLAAAEETGKEIPDIEKKTKNEAKPKCEYLAYPQIPRRALLESINGTVKAKITILRGSVTSVEIVSGPEVFHEAVISAIKQYRCTSNENPVTMTQEFQFKVSEPEPSGKPSELRKPVAPVFQPLPGHG